MSDISPKSLEQAATLVARAKRLLVFTGAGVSVESGIPTFRGADGLWSRYDSSTLELSNFVKSPDISWPVIKEVFYQFFNTAQANAAHLAIAELEKAGLVSAVVTQNIDGLHQDGGSTCVIEFHGTLQSLSCLECGRVYAKCDVDFEPAIPRCVGCAGVLKPDFVFFGEGIPEQAYGESLASAKACDVVLIVGTSGEVMPACSIPRLAKQSGAKVIEVNTATSLFTDEITDIFLEGPAGVTLAALSKLSIEILKDVDSE